MKNVRPSFLITFLILSTCLIVNCENTKQDITPAGKNLAAVLSEMAQLGRAEKKIVTFDIVYDKRSGMYAYENVKLIKHSKEAMDFTKAADPAFKYAGDSYEVECTDAEGNTETTTCGDYACVGYYVALCVENGGCAQICKANAMYYPPELQ